MIVKPTDPNAVIRDPHTRVQLPAEGAEVPDNNFWRRRILAGECTELDDLVGCEEPAVVQPGGPPPRSTQYAEGEPFDRVETHESVLRTARGGPVGNEPLAPLTTRTTRKGP